MNREYRDFAIELSAVLFLTRRESITSQTASAAKPSKPSKHSKHSKHSRLASTRKQHVAFFNRDTLQLSLRLAGVLFTI